MKNLKKEIQKYWSNSVPGLDEASKHYEPGTPDFYRAVDSRRYQDDPYITRLLDELADGAGRLLEIGFGLGSDIRYLSKKGAKVFGIDLSPGNARLSTRGFSVLGLPGKALAGDAENLPFADESFSLVYSFGALHHTPDTDKALREIERVLKKKGRFLIMLYHQGLAYRWINLQYQLQKFREGNVSREDMITRKYDHTPLSKMYSRNELQRMFNNFRNVRIDIVTYGGVKRNRKLFWIYYLLNAIPLLMKALGSFAVIKGEKSG